MSRNALIVLSVVNEKKTVTEVAREFSVSQIWVYELLRRHKLLGPAAFDARSKAHHTDPNSLSDEMHELIARFRHELNQEGLDAGASSIRFMIQKQLGTAPSLSSIWRSLRKQGLVEYTPKKKPKLYLQRFEAELPNETWQSDFTHVRLQNGNDILVLNFLDDHSRLLHACTAHRKLTSPDAVEAFSVAAQDYGYPQSSLTDNGLIYTTRLIGGKNAYEILLARLGIEQKNSRPNHPQTQGKIERFRQTLKKWLASRPKARNVAELQALLDQFRDVYNNQRPHRALDGKTPQEAYLARPKATPRMDPDLQLPRPLNNKVDPWGKVSIRVAGRMRHVGVGREHRGKKVWVLMSSKLVIVTEKKPGVILSENKVEPTLSYWRQTKNPERSLDL